MAQDDVNSEHLQEITQEMYKRNLELAVVNKTLSLLRKLYQISLLTLDPPVLSERISDTIRSDLNLETVGVFHFDNEKDILTPFRISKSERFETALVRARIIFAQHPIMNVFKQPALKEVIYDQAPIITARLHDLWGGEFDSAKLDAISKEAHLKTLLLYPLVTENKTIGLLALGLNRDYGDLSTHEKNAIDGLIDVTAVALDKALLYGQLKEANEQLKILDRARAEFITIASHQLRTPPATIKWYLASINAGDFGEVPPKILEMLKKTEWTNNGLIATIEDLLNVSRIERGKMEFNFSETDVLEITQSMVDQLTPQALNKKLSLVFNKPKAAPPKVQADKEKLTQVINNLIDNAVKYTKTGTVTVDLSTDKENIIIKVTDSGRGIKHDQLEAIFDKFDRGKDAPKNSSGLGLGLYVAKVIMDHHHGKIWAESEGEGRGSTFIVTIPIKNHLEKSVFDMTKV